ncbi:MAG: single-stranded DNA-binding protein [Verrucomicrobiae bacterium]|nr:single-stranded DNA-binding protein [Verrucomicrobiae bacterium]
MTGRVVSVELFKADGRPSVLNVCLVHNRRVGEKEHAEWVSVKFWNAWGEHLLPHLHKGDRILVRGRPEAKGFARKDGSIAAEFVLHASMMEFLSPGKRSPDDAEEDDDI